MTSTQRGESANHLLKMYIPRADPMHLFVSQYNRMIADRVADEGKEEHATKQVSHTLRVGVPIEVHASRVYTRAMYERFSKELFKTGAFSCVTESEGAIYRIVVLDQENVTMVLRSTASGQVLMGGIFFVSARCSSIVGFHAGTSFGYVLVHFNF
ncbi:hypothetical protein ACP70R_049053 [Stipagrostis hirtigluma subsp. patula]